MNIPKITRDEVLEFVNNTRPRSNRQRKLKEKILAANMRIQNVYSLHQHFEKGQTILYQPWITDEMGTVWPKGRGEIKCNLGTIIPGRTRLAEIADITPGGQRIDFNFVGDRDAKLLSLHTMYVTRSLNYSPFTGVYIGVWPHSHKEFRELQHIVEFDPHMRYPALEGALDWKFQKWESKYMFTPILDWGGEPKQYLK